VIFLDIEPAFAERVREFVSGVLAKEGFAPGRDVQVDLVNLWQRGREVERMADEVVAARPDAVVVNGSRDALLFKQRTRDIPVIFRSVGDPVRIGLVASLAHPGSNFTGQSNASFTLDGKRVEVLRELRPRLQRVTLATIDTPTLPFTRASVKAAAAKLGLAYDELVFPAALEDASVVERRVLSAAPESLVVQFLDAASANLPRFLATLESRGIPAIYANERIVRAGGLASLGQVMDDFDPAQVHVLARILRGEKPAGIPVTLITQTHLALNRKTARAMGIAIPDALRLRVNELVG
jgi:putative ABC transport system substrate-binding protein